jgi:hypothetical protein
MRARALIQSLIIFYMQYIIDAGDISSTMQEVKAQIVPISNCGIRGVDESKLCTATFAKQTCMVSAITAPNLLTGFIFQFFF